MRVIIIGSGIAGLSAAIVLRRVGIEVTVYERARELTEVGAGITLWANALRALDAIGAGEAVRAVANPVALVEFRTNEGYRVAHSIEIPAVEASLGPSPLLAIIHRAELVEALGSILPRGVARYGYECTGVEQDDNRAAATFRNGHRDEADVVIGADGIRSVVRASLFRVDEPRYSGYTCWRGVCPRPASVPPGYTGEWWGRGQRLGMAAMAEDRVYWFATQNQPSGRHAENEQACLSDAFRTWADPAAELITTTPPDRVLRNDIIDRPPLPRWSKGRIGLIGDAAHATTPNLGQGGCQAIEDSVALARCLLARSLYRDAADYGRGLIEFYGWRHERTDAITRESWQFGRIAQWENPIACRFRDLLFTMALRMSSPRALARQALYDIGPLK